MRRWGLVLLACFSAWCPAVLLSYASSAAPSANPLTLDERIEAQRKIEQVYWAHRIWPEQNPGPKPALSAVMSDRALRERVEDYLKKSNLLGNRWHEPVESANLQAELDRLTRRTQDSATLRELFTALGNDPRLIAQTLARRTLVERRVRGLFNQDFEIHRDVREQAEAALASCGDQEMACMAGRGAEVRRVRWVRKSEEDAVEVATEDAPNRVRLDRIELPGREWDRLRSTLSGRSGIVDRDDRLEVVEVESSSSSDIVASVASWPKVSFEGWWSKLQGDLPTDIDEPPAEFSVGSIEDATCGERWRPTLTDVPDPSDYHSAVWTGSEMIVWGGRQYRNSGGRYEPATDTWTLTSVGINVPDPRYIHSAVWTGTEMIVWGGQLGAPGPNTPLNTGGRYNPVTDTWAPTSVGANLPLPRYRHAVVWTGSEMIVWGGSTPTSTNTGGRYDPASDTWLPTSLGAGVPTSRISATGVWTGSQMIVWGGIDGPTRFNSGARYSPASDTWVPTSMGANLPAIRIYHGAVWTGSEMIVWGGNDGSVDGSADLNTGGRYNPVSDAWTATSTGANVPIGRESHTAVWTGSEMIVWGGTNLSAYLQTGGRYNPASNTWTATSTGTNVPAARSIHTAVWTGTEMIVWGGLGTESRFASGGRYRPSTNSWLPTFRGTVPEARSSFSLIWTGAEMIVWGGDAGPLLNSGGRYDPATDSWTPTSTGANIPSARATLSAVWTGTEMIVWGGNDGTNNLNTGGRYAPATNTWLATSTAAGVPAARTQHTAVWTGTQMIVWGGNAAARLNTGGRYTPATNSWTATSTGANVPGIRSLHTAIWSGSEMIVWGGYSGSAYLNTGGRYNSATNAWTATSTGSNVPGIRNNHSAVWTGTRMIVWGGFSGSARLNTGGQYDPGTNTWLPTSVGADVPEARNGHAAEWTGSEMIVWGGGVPSGSLNTGGLYSPLGDSWRPTSVDTGVPLPTFSPTTVWTGSEMIVWGVGMLTSSGGRYRPPNDGTPCDDAEICTTNDACLGSSCTGAPLVCNDGNACTDDSCLSGTGCVTTSVNCDDSNPCTEETCDTVSGCQHTDQTPPVVDGLVTQDATSVAWATQGAGVTYDLLRGAAGEWPVGSGASEVCVASGIATTSAADQGTPGSGAGYFYLVRASRGSCHGSYGNASDGNPRVSSICP